jgi:hypothetical protein
MLCLLAGKKYGMRAKWQSHFGLFAAGNNRFLCPTSMTSQIDWHKGFIALWGRHKKINSEKKEVETLMGENGP